MSRKSKKSVGNVEFGNFPFPFIILSFNKSIVALVPGFSERSMKDYSLKLVSVLLTTVTSIRPCDIVPLEGMVIFFFKFFYQCSNSFIYVVQFSLAGFRRSIISLNKFC